jgi:hypothetical protein
MDAPENLLSPSPYPYIEVGMVIIGEKGVLSHIRMVQAAIILPASTFMCFAYS